MSSLDTSASVSRRRISPTTRGAAPSRRAAPEIVDENVRGMPVLVAIFLVSLPVPVMFNLGPVLMMPYRLVLLVAFVPLALRFFVDPRFKLHVFDWLVVGWVGWSILALLVNHGTTQIAFAGSRAVEVLGAWMLARVGIRSAEDMQRMVRILFLIVLFLLPLAAIESFTGRRPLAVLPGVRTLLDTGGRWGLNRANVAFTHPILYGIFVASVTSLVWFLYGSMTTYVVRIFRSLIIFAATFFSLSAGAIVAFMVQAVMIAWDVVFQKSSRRWLVFGWLIVGFYVTVDMLSNRTPFHLVVDYLTFNQGAAYYRILIYRFGIESVWANPIFGIGLHDWARAYWMGDTVDNFWLLNAMQYGIPGFLCLAGGSLMIVRSVIRSPLTDAAERNCRLGWVIAMCGVMMAAGTVHYWTTMLSYVVFLMGSGGWMACPPAQSPAPRSRSGAPAASDRRAKAGTDMPPTSRPERPTRSVRSASVSSRRRSGA